MTKTPYEIRLEVLKLAQDQANAKFYHQWEQAVRIAENSKTPSMLTEVPVFPTSEQILIEAEKLKGFIDKA